MMLNGQLQHVPKLTRKVKWKLIDSFQRVIVGGGFKEGPPDRRKGGGLECLSRSDGVSPAGGGPLCPRCVGHRGDSHSWCLLSASCVLGACRGPPSCVLTVLTASVLLPSTCYGLGNKATQKFRNWPGSHSWEEREPGSEHRQSSLTPCTQPQGHLPGGWPCFHAETFPGVQRMQSPRMSEARP